MPLLIEAPYLITYPENRKGQPFVRFATEGDAISMLDVLMKYDSDDEAARIQQATINIDIPRYQDSLGRMNSALHAAFVDNNEDVAWLLLWLASGLDDSVFRATLCSVLRRWRLQE